MTISTKTTAGGEIRCTTEIDGRRYGRRYRGCNIGEARRKFRKRVEAVESKLMEEKRQKIIDVCLNCQIPAEQCNGSCKIDRAIRIKRGKGVK